MFLVTTFPVADFRHLHREELGRLSKPRWGQLDPDAKFMRGFGSIHRRTRSGIGFNGEEFYADFDNMLKFPRKFLVKPFPREPETIPAYPIFRRFYFDGVFSGKFEVGFRLDEDLLHHYAETSPRQMYNVEGIADQILNQTVEIILPDTRRINVALSGAGEHFAHSYLLNSTKNSSPYAFSVRDEGHDFLFVAKPFTFVRSTNLTPIQVSNQRRPLVESPLPKTELSRSNRSNQDFDLVIQSSQFGLEDESPDERAIRITYNQLRMLITAHSFYLKQYRKGFFPRTNDLKKSVKAFLHRASAPPDSTVLGTASNSARAILRGENVNLDKLVEEIETTLERSLFQRLICKLPKIIDRKMDVAIEATAKAATDHALGGGL